MMLTPALCDTMVAVYEHPGCDVAALADALGLSAHAARFRVRKLVAAGFARMVTRRRWTPRPGQRRPTKVVEPVFPPAITVDGERYRLVLLDPPGDAS